ncbi:multiple epidermal growth factor-like domains protein 10 isoform X2 [Gigantopelta aegis]|uniref:multiple epidermal growth factor-like domains protein 10 isoform X2 n=1 Tax=Gigantopelta aegis TaxID=1735272 RepID=UPI001B88E704|nr:multiple epidermal growth factor-like domains protein 10 isoform X2 [Gigantopelta aegis]
MATVQGGELTCIFIVGYLIYFSITQVSGKYQCHCAEGCTGNVEGYRCKSCKQGYHGMYCQIVSGNYQCHCAEGCIGNIEEYICKSCKEGYYGLYCQMENVALRKQAQHSKECEDYSGKASIAVDGNTTTEFGDKAPHGCTCSIGKDKFWSVDLGKEYLIKNIKIYQRNQTHNVLYGLHIEIDGHECYRWPNTSEPPTVFDVTCDRHGRKVTFKMPDDIVVLALCEIQIFVCTDFWYGDDCTKTCKCRNEVCDKKTGKCKHCRESLTTDSCDACTDFWYGDGCVKTCNCRNKYEVCDKKTGKCTDCPDHYTGDACDACDDGYWGKYCLKCGHCKAGEICNKTTGHCQECRTGWELPRCTTCVDFMHGCSCNITCNCEDTTEICNKETGACDSEADASVHDGAIAAIGAILCVGFVIAVVAQSVSFWRRKKKAGSEDKDILVQSTDMGV